jgi:hypothetical protein
LEEKGGKAAACIMVEEVLRAAGFDPDTLPVEHLDMDHPAVKAVADEICRVGNELLA